MHRTKWALLGLVAAAALAGTGLVGAAFVQAGDDDGGTEQPIAFPHDKHAGEPNNIDCQYCHYTARRSPDAGIPSVQLCIGCHAPGGVPLVRADSVGVKQLLDYWQAKQPIEWVRIYDLPDHARFPHMMHVNADLTCQECHGAVETMPVVEQVPSLQMGWCIECHRTREVRTDCTVCHY